MWCSVAAMPFDPKCRNSSILDRLNYGVEVKVMITPPASSRIPPWYCKDNYTFKKDYNQIQVNSKYQACAFN